MVDSTDIEPGKPTPRNPPDSPPLAPTAFLEPADRKDPVPGHNRSEVVFLTVQVTRYVVAQEGEETGDCEGLVAVPDDFEVDRVPVEEVGQERNAGVYGDHEEDSDDTT